MAAILWDNDGVLVDTEGLYLDATREILATVGVDLTTELYRQLFLVEDRGAWHLAAERGVPAARLEELRVARDARYAELLAGGVGLAPGVEDLLAGLSAGHRMAVVTSSRRGHFELIHQRNRLDRFMELILCREDYARSKPHPEPYLAAVARLGVSAADCLVVEDSVRGLASARAAGLRCWVCPSGLTRGMDFTGAERVLASLDEVGELSPSSWAP